MPTLFRNQTKDPNPVASPITLNILSFISRLNALNPAEKEQLYFLFQQASTDDITDVFKKGGIETLAKILKQEKTKHIFSSSPAYLAADILAVFFSRNNAYRAITLNSLLQSNIANPDTRAKKFLRDINYEDIIQSTFNKTMYTLRTSRSTCKCASLVNLLNTLLLAKENLLKKYDTKSFIKNISEGTAFDGAGLNTSAHGTVKRFFMKQDSIKQKLIDMMERIPDTKKSIKMDHIKQLNQRHTHATHNAHDSCNDTMSLIS